MMARVLRGSSQDVQLLVRHPGLWERWLGKLRKRGFFGGVDGGVAGVRRRRVRRARAGVCAEPGRAGVRLWIGQSSRSLAPSPARSAVASLPPSTSAPASSAGRSPPTCLGSLA